MPCTCLNKADNFCNICDDVAIVSYKRSITTMVRKSYHLYFGCKIGMHTNMLQHVSNLPSTVVEQGKEIYDFCGANDLERANRS